MKAINPWIIFAYRDEIMDNKNLSLEQKRKALLAAMLKKEGLGQSHQNQIEKQYGSKAKPLSFAQERLWFLDRFEPENPIYNIAVSLRLEGPLDVDIFKKSVNSIIKHQAALRTVFEHNGDSPEQKVLPHLNLQVIIVNLNHLSRNSQREEIEKHTQHAAEQIFNLAEGPLIDCRLLKIKTNVHVCLLTMHHIISDESSFTIFFKELSSYYQVSVSRKEGKHTINNIQYTDYAVWQREQIKQDSFKQQLKYWKNKLSGDLPVLQLPLDFPRPFKQTFHGNFLTSKVSADLTKHLKKLASQEKATLFMALITAYKILLFRYNGQEDILIGTPVNNRDRTELQDLVGYFQNTLVLRSRLNKEETFINLLKVIRKTALDAFENQTVPFEKLVEILQPDRDLSINPIFQAAFIFQNNLMENSWKNTLNLPGIKVEPVITETTSAKFDLTFAVEELDEGLTIGIEYNTDLFSVDTISRILNQFQILLQSIIDYPSEPIGNLVLLGDEDRKMILEKWNQTAEEIPEKCLHHLIELQAEATPESTAVVFEDECLTYSELNRQADNLSTYLASLDVKPGELVGVCLDRTPGMIVTLIAILKAGYAYVPLDPDFPSERLGFMIQDAKINLIISHSDLEKKLKEISGQILLIDQVDEERSQIKAINKTAVNPAQLAYVLYTSGSTGNPKGVEISHRSVVNFLTSMKTKPGISTRDKLLSVTTLSFDISILELFLPLICGAQLVLCRKEITIDGQALTALIKSSNITIMQATPATWWMMLESGWHEKLPLKILCGGEALTSDLAQKLLPLSNELWNMYGPTETTIWSTISQVSEADEPISIGHPIANTDCYILDENLQPVPVGAFGELFIGGAGLAKGYLERKELTQEKFVPHPFKSNSGQRIYRTGDLAKYLPDGRIVCLGRIDNQVKIRGFRIELGEIEASLNLHKSIAQSVVIAEESTPGDKRLLAYFTSSGEDTLDILKLQTHLRSKLPDYMIPSVFIELNEFPLTLNNKIDRNALPLPDMGIDNRSGEKKLPETEIQKKIARVWMDVLKVHQVYLDDNFFGLGGHSLLATRAIFKINKQLNKAISLHTLFDKPALLEFATELDEAESSSTSLPSIKPIDRLNKKIPLSFSQRRLWFLSQFENHGAAYNVTASYRFKGLVDVQLLEKALNIIIQKHESFRISFVLEEDEPHLIISESKAYSLQQIDLESIAGDQKETELQAKLKEQSEIAILISDTPLWRALVFRLSSSELVLQIVMHHSISDGTSLQILYRELCDVYRQLSSGLVSEANLVIQYADYADWQNNQVKTEILKSQEIYWRQTMDGAIMELDLPTDFPRPPEQTFKGAVKTIFFPHKTVERLKKFGQEENSSLFMVLTGMFNVLLHRYTGQEDIVVGTPIAGRNHPQTQSLIGYFVNSLVLRTDISGKPTFRELLKRIRDSALGAYENQDIPFEQVVEIVQPKRDFSRSPVFQVMISLESVESTITTINNVSVEIQESHNETSKFDLSFYCYELSDKLQIGAEYNSALFNGETIERLLQHFSTLVDSVLETPDMAIWQLAMLSDSDRSMLLGELNQTGSDLPNVTLFHRLFENKVIDNPNAIALIFKDSEWSYESLNHKANKFAHYLQKGGVQQGDFVGICLNRSSNMLIALLAVMKSGGTYIPLDPDYPQERLEFMVDDSHMRWIITEHDEAVRFSGQNIVKILIDKEWDNIEKESIENLSLTPENKSLAYVIYTSGSSGQPKGVQISHHALLNFLLSMQKEPGLKADDRLLAVTTLSFDIAGLELFLPLITGAVVVLASQNDTMDGQYLIDLINQKNISLMQATPSTWHLLLDSGWQGKQDLRILCGGEAMTIELAKKLLSKCKELWNMYGPTETTIWSLIKKIEPGFGNITLGKPIDNTRIFILNENLQPQPIGVPGELHISGEGLASGYLNRPELTAGRFIDTPQALKEFEPDLKLYKTGDLSRFLPNGDIEFLGRLDHQVKVRGYRIELGEIEAVLSKHPVVSKAIVVAWDYDLADRRLVVYLLSKENQPVKRRELRRYLKERLPDYMIPADFIPLDKFPLTPNGKIDRKAFPKPGSNLQEQTETYIAPKTNHEKQIAQTWQSFLKIEKVGLHDNFFDLGGHSLLSIKVIIELEKMTGERISPRDMLLQNVEQLAKSISERKSKIVQQIDKPKRKGLFKSFRF